MRKPGLIIGIIIVILLAGAAVFALTNMLDDDTNTGTTDITSQTSSDNTESSTAAPSESQSNISSEAATITYTNDGFSPTKLTVKAGTRVTIKNTSSTELNLLSNPHPVHTDNPELNTENIGPGESTTFTPTIKGTWGYHNHENSGDTGTLIVQ